MITKKVTKLEDTKLKLSKKQQESTCEFEQNFQMLPKKELTTLENDNTIFLFELLGVKQSGG